MVAPPTHHRFRHTFARILLQQGDVSIRDVAELLGDTEETVRKHTTPRGFRCARSGSRRS